MKRLNKKGMTLTELIVSLVLVSIVVVIILQLLVDIRYEDTLTKKRTSNMLTQSLLMKDIQDDLLAGMLKEIHYNDSSITFTYSYETIELIVYDDYIVYDKEKYIFSGTKISENSKILVNYELDTDNKYVRFTILVGDNNYNYDIEILYTFSLLNDVIVSEL